MRTINTSSGPVVVDPDPPRHVNTSDVLEPPRMEYLDEEPEIIAVVPAADWCAAVGEARVPLVVFVAMDDGRLYGVVVGDDGKVDLVEGNVEDRAGFVRYEQINEPKEI